MWESREDVRNCQSALDVMTLPLWSMNYCTHLESGMNSLVLTVMTMSPSSGQTLRKVSERARLTASAAAF